jgi:hypothetical protein
MQTNDKNSSLLAAQRVSKPVPDETLDRDTKGPLQGADQRRDRTQRVVSGALPTGEVRERSRG